MIKKTNNNKLLTFSSENEVKNSGFLLAGELFDRNEFSGSITDFDNAQAYDEYIINTGFAKDGIDFFKKLNGNWVYVCENNTDNSLVIAKGWEDKLPLFYYHNGNELIFSLFQQELTNSPNVPKDINELFVASSLNCLPQEPSATAYLHIKTVAPGQVLTLKGDELKIKQYWGYDDFKSVKLNSDKEYEEKYLELYRKSVKRCLSKNGETGIFLSGGLDSSTVAVLAAEELLKQGKTLHAFTSVPQHDTKNFLQASRFGDESNLVKLLAEKYENISLNFIQSENISILDSLLTALEYFDQPLHAVGNMFWMLNICSISKERNIDTMLIGKHGNMGVSFEGLENHFKSIGDYLYYRKTIQKLNGVNSRKSKIRMFMPKIFMNVARKIKGALKGNKPRAARASDWRNFSAINHDFARKLNLYDVQPFADNDNTETKIKKRFERSLGGLNFRGYMQVSRGLTIPDPTYNKELLNFCFGIPDKQWKRYGVGRFLIRRAFDKKMPKEIIWNVNRGRQAADVSLRIAAEYERFNNVMTQLKKSPYAQEMLNLDMMQKILERTKTEVSQEMFSDAGTILLRGLMTGLFLLKAEGNKLNY